MEKKQEEFLKNYNDSLLKEGNVYERFSRVNTKTTFLIESSKFNYLDILVSRYFPPYFQDNGMNINSNIITLGVSIEGNNTYKHRDTNYNLVYKEIFSTGFNILYSNSDISFDNNQANISIDPVIGLGQSIFLDAGYGYGIKLKGGKSIILSTKLGLNLGVLALSNAQSTDLLYNDLFCNQIEYNFNRKYALSASFVRVKHYYGVDIVNNFLSKGTEVAVYALVDNYFVDYLQTKRLEYLPIYNLLAQNLVQFIFHQMKLNNSDFPFKSDGEAFNGYSYRISFSYVF